MGLNSMSHTGDAVNQIETDCSLSLLAAINQQTPATIRPAAILVRVAGNPANGMPRWINSPLMSDLGESAAASSTAESVAS